MPSQRWDTAVLGEVAVAGVAQITGDTNNVQAIRCMQQVTMVTRFLAHPSFNWEKSANARLSVCIAVKNYFRQDFSRLLKDKQQSIFTKLNYYLSS